MNEVWKDIKGFEGCYQVSSLGNVRALERKVKTKGNGLSTKKAKIIAQHWRGRLTKGKNPKSKPLRYLSVYLQKEGKGYNFVTHRLVAQAFIPNPKNKPQVNHIDGNRGNNMVTNLEWCTQQENRVHADANGLHMGWGEDHHNSKLTWKKVEEIRSKYIPRKYSQHKLAREYGINQATVWAILKKETWVKPKSST